MKNTITAGILIFLGIICAGMALHMYRLERYAGSEYEELRQEVKQPTSDETANTATPEPTVAADLSGQAAVTPAPTTQPEPTEIPEGNTEVSATPEPTPVPVEIPVDFATLQEMNPDIYAWITIPGTVVDYPILQHPTEEEFYLRRNIQKEKATEGVIFTQFYNSRDFEDINTVIYGHDMKNGTMFRSLHEYEDRVFFDENREILIYLPTEIRHYQIFAAYVYDNRNILLSIDFSDPRVYQAYLDRIFAIRDMGACIDRDSTVTTEDKIITLSTCNAGKTDERYLVQAVLVSIEK